MGEVKEGGVQCERKREQEREEEEEKRMGGWKLVLDQDKTYCERRKRWSPGSPSSMKCDSFMRNMRATEGEKARVVGERGGREGRR